MKHTEDRIYPSDNRFDIPTLREDMQPNAGLLLPFCGWGISRRIKQSVLTYHFYVDDYRFENLWINPDIILKSSCREIVEPNFSVYDTTPVAYGIQQIYKKRWLSRYYQEHGLKVYADLNVSSKFYEFNRLGIPDGYNAFATRGYSDRLDLLRQEIAIARRISGCDRPNMIVYGGGESVRDICLQTSVVFVQEFKPSIGKEAENG